MMERQYGKVVNVSSVAGVGTAFAGDMLYSTTKASVIMMTKHFALELGQYGINVNAVAPGLIWTDMMGSLNPEEREQQMKSFEEMCVLHRIGKPEEIANVILFLASEESSFMTAQVLTVDGGRTNFITRSL
jgi:NAD(P)-dependent dehydrogenase (short-subunit alcohol dehydrogenase family)